MVHAIEVYTSKRLKNPISDTLAAQALRLLATNIRAVCRDPANGAARQDMLVGSMLAGMAFANAPVAAVHALAYPIGAQFHVPHGLSNAMVLPHVIRFNALAAEALYAEIADIMVPGVAGSAEARTVALVEDLAGLAPALGLDTSLYGAGIRHNHLPRLAEDAMKQTRLLINNPREVTYDDALRSMRRPCERASAAWHAVRLPRLSDAHDPLDGQRRLWAREQRRRLLLLRHRGDQHLLETGWLGLRRGPVIASWSRRSAAITAQSRSRSG